MQKPLFLAPVSVQKVAMLQTAQLPVGFGIAKPPPLPFPSLPPPGNLAKTLLCTLLWCIFNPPLLSSPSDPPRQGGHSQRVLWVFPPHLPPPGLRQASFSLSFLPAFPRHLIVFSRPDLRAPTDLTYWTVLMCYGLPSGHPPISPPPLVGNANGPFPPPFSPSPPEVPLLTSWPFLI